MINWWRELWQTVTPQQATLVGGLMTIVAATVALVGVIITVSLSRMNANRQIRAEWDRHRGALALDAAVGAAESLAKAGKRCDEFMIAAVVFGGSHARVTEARKKVRQSAHSLGVEIIRLRTHGLAEEGELVRKVSDTLQDVIETVEPKTFVALSNRVDTSIESCLAALEKVDPLGKAKKVNDKK